MTAWEAIFLWVAIALYILSGGVSLAGIVFKRESWLGGAIFPGWMGLLLHGSAILLRWVRVGHGPYMTLLESLSSDLWMGVAFYLGTVLRFRRLNVANGVVMPITFTLMGWLMLSDPTLKGLPPTYHTVWLVVHIFFGKLSYGSILVAVGLAALVITRERVSSSFWRERIPETDKLDDLAYRFMAFGFIFETLMIIAGAIWAQNAWGRYWSWDPLEVWSLSTWIVLALYFHLRLAFDFKGKRSALYILFAFVFSFLSFLGIPFVSQSTHQGVF